MSFVKNFEELKFVPPYYKQVFVNRFSNSIEKTQIINSMYSGDFSTADIEVFKFLFKVRYATVDQVYKYLLYKGFITDQVKMSAIKSKLDYFMNIYRAVNKFGLAMEVTDTFDDSALSIYCLDTGGQFLLHNFTEERLVEIQNWRAKSANLHTATVVFKDLYLTDLYLKLLSIFGDNLKYFKYFRKMSCEKTSVVVGFDFLVNIDGDNKYFIGDVFRDTEVLSTFPTQVDNVEKIVATNAWKKYCFNVDKEPMYICIAEDENDALQLAESISYRKMPRFRMSTLSLMEGDLSKALLSYNPDNKTLEAKVSKMFKMPEDTEK